MPPPDRSAHVPDLRPWAVGTAVLALVAAIILLAPPPEPEPPLQLVALGADGTFTDTLVVLESVPGTGRDRTTTRVPLILGVRNTGDRAGRPEQLSLSLPARHRLRVTGADPEIVVQAGSPLATYTLPTGLTSPVAPGRLPELLPSADTVWLDVVVPRFYCVALDDSVPELIPAPTAPVETRREIRIFYSFVGGDLERRRTGTLTVQLDSSLVAVEPVARPPSYPVRIDTARASPDVGPLRLAGRRQSRCGEPQRPMELVSALRLTADGGRVLELEYGGLVRKRLYDLDADGVVERESWDADGDGTFEATRRARLPIPEFLMPEPAADTIPG